MWGNVYYNYETRRFVSKPPSPRAQRSFVQFCLEPMYPCNSFLISRYKLYSQVLGSETPELSRVLKELNISLTKQELQMDPAPLLKLVMRQFFTSHGGLVDALVQTVPDPTVSTRGKVQRFWLGERDCGLANAMNECNAKGPLVINVVKMMRNQDGSDFMAFGRILSGTVKSGMEVDVLGEG